MSKVLIFINIPTHARPLIELAYQLHRSGQYKPVLIYYPSAVFEQNHADCRNAPFDAYIWSGYKFVTKDQYLTTSSGADHSYGSLDDSQSAVSRNLVSRFISKSIGFIIYVAHSLGFKVAMFNAIQKILTFTAYIVGAIAMIASIFRNTVLFFPGTALPNQKKPHLENKTALQRFLLGIYELQWNSLSDTSRVPASAFYHRITRLLSDGFFAGMAEQKMLLNETISLIRQEDVVAVAMAEDNLFYNSHFVILASHSVSVPAIIVPYTIVNTLEWAEAFYDLKSYQIRGLWSALIAKAFPNWILVHRDRNLILPSTYVLGCEFHNLTPDVPWLINSGKADAIAVESELMRQYYSRAGVREDILQFTGSLSDDKIFNLLRNRFDRRKTLGVKHRILIKNRVILIALPPNQFGGGKRPGSEFDSYVDLTNFIVETVTSTCDENTTIIVNLHPRIDRAEVTSLADFKVHIVDEPIDNLVPLADLFIAVASATIRLGISCGIPVINYDAYQYNYDDYKNIEGVCDVKSKTGYSDILKLMCDGNLLYSQKKNAQEKIASELCLIDGNAGQRMVGLFDRLVSKPVPILQ